MQEDPTKIVITPNLEEAQVDEKYLERKNLIKTPDEELIKQAKEKAGGFQDSNVEKIYEAVLNNGDFFKDKKGTGKLFDIGAGKYGAINKEYFFHAGIEEITLVEPVVKKEQMKGGLEDLEAEGKMKFAPEDGLSFLLSQPDNAGNVMIASIDADVIPVYEYLDRIAQEVYRVVPPNGYCVSILSREIERELEQLFPLSKKFGYVNVFYKNKTEGELEKEKDAIEARILLQKWKEVTPENEDVVQKMEFKQLTIGLDISDMQKDSIVPAEKQLTSAGKMSPYQVWHLLDCLTYEAGEQEDVDYSTVFDFEKMKEIMPVMKEILDFTLKFIEKHSIEIDENYRK